jgi:hypothetical protein
MVEGKLEGSGPGISLTPGVRTPYAWESYYINHIQNLFFKLNTMIIF